AEALCRFIIYHVILLKALYPEIEAAFGYCIPNFGSHSRPPASLWYPIAPGKKCKYGARTSCFIPKIKMVGARIIKIYCFFNEAQPEYFRIEIEISFWIAGYCRNMVNA